MTSKPASFKKNEGYVYNNFSDKRKKVKPKFEVNDLVRTADFKKPSQKEIQLTGLINYARLQNN